MFIALSSASGVVLEETFSSAPERWLGVGDTNLFRWDTTEQALEVTWDSSRPNSFFALPLGTVLSRSDDFTLGFDLDLHDFAAGITPGKENPFQISIGLMNLAVASGTNFVRGTGYDTPNLLEFSFFPDPGGAWQWGPSLTVSMIDSTGTNWSYGGFAPLSLSTGGVYHVTMAFTAADQKLRTTLTKDGEPVAVVDPAYPSPSFVDFQLDHFMVASYSEEGQNPAYSGSVLAHGRVDNVTITLPPPPVSVVQGSLEGTEWKVSYVGKTNWVYALERTSDFKTWSLVSAVVSGTGSQQSLVDTNIPPSAAFYRVRASRP
jgi:hypothetical protein